MKEYESLDEKMGFGRHKHSTLRQVLIKYPKYIIWAYENIDDFIIPSEMQDEIYNNEIFSEAKQLFEQYWAEQEEIRQAEIEHMKEVEHYKSEYRSAMQGYNDYYGL